MPEAAPHSQYRILLVDDQPGIHADYRKVLSGDDGIGHDLQRAREDFLGDAPPYVCPVDFELDSAYQGEEALRMVMASLVEKRPYAVAFIDMRMPPGWDGIETVERFWEVDPDLQIVLCTAYTDYSWEEIAERLGQTDRLVILAKPFENLEARQLAHSLTEKWRLLQVTRSHTADLEERVRQRTSELRVANDKLQAEMTERALAESAFRQAQKMEAVGHLAGGLAHDFNNLISVIRGFSGLLLMEEKHDALTRESLNEVDGAAERAANLTRQLLTFSRQHVMQPQDLDINEVVSQVTKLLRCMAGETIALKFQLDSGLPCVRADRGMLEQVILNLAVNARDAMPDGGELTITNCLVEFSEEEARCRPHSQKGCFVCLTVKDTGYGIPAENMSRLFEPFYTTKEVGKGTGLGLATVYGIVRQHEGWVEVESQVGAGSAFKVFLPGTNSIASGASQANVCMPVRGDETILVVEDEPAVRNAARQVLQYYGYRVYTAESGHDALSLWPKHGNEIDLVLADVVMPGGMSGCDLGQRLQSEKAGLKVIYSSGYSSEVANKDGRLKEGLNYLPKPYPPSRLARLVRACLDSDGELLAVPA